MDWVKSFVATVRDSVATPVNNPGVAETPGRWTYVIAAFMESFGANFLLDPYAHLLLCQS